MAAQSAAMRWLIYLIYFLCWIVLHPHSIQQGVTCGSFKALTPATVRWLTPLVCLLISFSLPEADLMKQPFLAGLSYWCPGRSNFDLRRWWNDFPWSLDVRLDHQLMIVEKGCQLKADLMEWLGLPEKAVACFTHLCRRGKIMCLLAQLQSADSCSSCRISWWS